MTMSTIDRRIILVLGKGGVGKTTVATALALGAVDQGLRVLVAETCGSTQIPALFGMRSQGYRSMKLRPGLHTMSITAHETLADYATGVLKIERLVRMLFESRFVAPLVDGVPGLHDVMQLGAVFEQSRRATHGMARWDRIVVDGPATGHGRTLLDSPRSMMEVTRSGPLYDGARQVHAVLSDRHTTGLVLVTLAEELAVRETLELWESLAQARAQVVACVLNQAIAEPPITATEWAQARDALLADADEPRREAVALAQAWLDQHARQQRAQRRLREALSVPIVALPRCPTSALGLDALEALADSLWEAPVA